MRAALALAVALLSGCAVYDGPPEPSLVGLSAGLLPDRHAPIVVAFSKPPVQDTVKIEIARYVVDSAGRLGDEPGNTLGMPLDVLVSHDGTDPAIGDTGGIAVFSTSTDGTTLLTITPDVPLPAGSQLVLLAEPGLADATGARTAVRRRVVFGYASNLDCMAPVSLLASGTYYFLVEIDQPIHAQLSMYGVLAIDPATGKTKSKFTKAHRNPDGSRCSPACDSSQVCRTLPGPPACVTPSTPADTVEEFPDYVPDIGTPTGFSFDAPGCAADVDGMTATFATSPVDVQVQIPMVTLRNAALNASFSPDPATPLHGTGQLTADAVLLGSIDSGKGHGNVTVRSLSDAETPKGLPQP